MVIEDSPQREQGRDRSVSRPASANRLKKKESRQSTSRDRKKEQIPEKKSQAQSAEHRGKGGSSQRQKHKTTQVKDEESTSNSDSEEEKNPNELFAWTVIIEERYTGTLACLPPKDRIELEEAFYRYLRTRQKNKEEKLHRYMANDAKGRRVVALPRKYVDDFQSWLDKEMDEGGLFQKTPKKKKIVVKTNVCFFLMIGMHKKDCFQPHVK